MTTIKATVRGRRLEVDVPTDWPDGIEVEIQPLTGMPPDGPMSAEEIARTLAAMDQIEPLVLTEAERRAWETERREQREREKLQFAEHAEKLRRKWE